MSWEKDKDREAEIQPDRKLKEAIQEIQMGLRDREREIIKQSERKRREERNHWGQKADTA